MRRLSPAAEDIVVHYCQPPVLQFEGDIGVFLAGQIKHIPNSGELYKLLEIAALNGRIADNNPATPGKGLRREVNDILYKRRVSNKAFKVMLDPVGFYDNSSPRFDKIAERIFRIPAPRIKKAKQ